MHVDETQSIRTYPNSLTPDPYPKPRPYLLLPNLIVITYLLHPTPIPKGDMYVDETQGIRARFFRPQQLPSHLPPGTTHTHP